MKLINILVNMEKELYYYISDHKYIIIYITGPSPKIRANYIMNMLQNAKRILKVQ